MKNFVKQLYHFLIPFPTKAKVYKLLYPGFYKTHQPLFDWLEHIDNPALFRASRQESRVLFKKYVSIVHLEISSFCNRACPYCPNSELSETRKQKTLLPEDLFISCLEQLKSIDYNNYIEFNGFDEPLYDRDLFLTRAKQVKEHLPNSHLVINSNGDYLNSDYLKEIASAGVSSLNITLHLTTSEIPLSDEMKKEKMSIFLNKFPDISFSINECEGYAVVDGMRVFFQVSSFNENGHNWAGTVGASCKPRKDPCFVPIKQIYVDYRGRVNLCCSVNMDCSGMEDFCIGDIRKNSLFELFASEKSAKIRRALVDMQKVPHCCQFCTAQSCYIFNSAFIHNPYYPQIFTSVNRQQTE